MLAQAHVGSVVAVGGAGGAAGLHMTGAPAQVVTGGGAGVCGTAAGGCGTVGCGTTTEVGTGVLTYVGTSGGEYVQETTYKYVGPGRGDLSFVTQSRSLWPCAVLVVLLLIAIVVVVVLPITTTTTTSMLPTRIGECLFWGDPHVETFDHARPSFYGEGEQWVVKNDRVKIQGRYAGTKFTLGLASTQKVVISGSFIGNHKIEVEPMELEFGGQIRVDGEPVLTSFGTYSVGGATIVYNDEGKLVDEAASQRERRIVHIDLPEGIHMDVFRWGNYIDMRIQMAALQGGQDGSCGNFNDDQSDDTTARIFDRLGSRVAPSELLFTRNTPVDFSPPMEKMLRANCPPSDMATAQDKCSRELGSSTNSKLMNACLFDRCFGANEHALQVAKTFATHEELKNGNLLPQ